MSTKRTGEMIGIDVPAAIIAIAVAVALNIAVVVASVYLRMRG
jgi:hypothetical protein